MLRANDVHLNTTQGDVRLCPWEEAQSTAPTAAFVGEDSPAYYALRA